MMIVLLSTPPVFCCFVTHKDLQNSKKQGGWQKILIVVKFPTSNLILKGKTTGFCNFFKLCWASWKLTAIWGPESINRAGVITCRISF